MSKLREKFLNLIVKTHITPIEQSEQCEQITDDFSVKLLKWYDNLKDESLIELSYTELQQYFKDNIYGN